MNNFSESIHMLSFVLMPNHFHQLVWQRDENAIDSYMNSLNTRYTSYFNRKYKRLGPLCQGVYKAVNISSEEQLLYVTSYIHRNPLPLISQGLALRDWKYSSYPNYLRIRNDSWLNAELILNNFPKTGNLTYKKFVEEEYSEKNTDGILTEVCIDDL
ncbi:hypothetical protein A2Z33_04500 [Candidatus Gottesmanbacteria bacterium RBG_16_52_11]|uniref:Transposase IS200-like domain-containing protein n=1 Tax=Candidatus Gottesmanbacteria bacterium RBG_16_52_11 TaxID=1798374 RepID=A0A1F5YWD9_9BACT|nr:MAG: hypothetical protein A2Z33_04500 [Candidatus Gottesmanbacteria bacterium RBG_16_52_11]